MLSSHNNNSLTIISLLIQRMANHHSFNGSFRESFTDVKLGYNLFIFIRLISDIIIQFLKSVRIRMSNKQFILLKDSTHLKRQSIIHPFWILLRNNTFFICNLFTKSSPSSLNIIVVFILGKRIDSWSHSIVK